MKKKDKIKEAAVSLFNEKGYQNVSLREIADKAGTTIGNLTYHFSQKADLLKSIVEDLQSSFLLSYPDGIHRVELLSYLLNSFMKIQNNQKENVFYYKNLLLITLESPEIMKHGNIFQEALFQYYNKILKNLRADLILNDQCDDKAIQSFVYALISLSSSWMQDTTPYNNEKLPKLEISFVLCNLLKPYISGEYMDEFDKLCKEKGMFSE